MRWLGFIALAFSAVAAPATRSSALADLADRARSQPPEFAADALLRIAASPEPADLVWKRQAVEDAFHLAASAQQPFARRSWNGSGGSLFDKAYAQGLDACTLQCRAVHAMLEFDFKKARELFESMPVPQLPHLSCEDSLVYDVDIFYATAGEVAARAFTPKEVAREEPFHFLERYAAGLTSPSQIAPIARLLTSASLSARHRETLVEAFAAALKQLSGDGRAFAATAAGSAESSAIAALGSQNALDAWRAYLVRNLKSARCADVVLSRQPAGVAPIAADEMKPASLDGKAVIHGQCDSSECRDLSKQYAALVMGTNSFALTPEQKSTDEWRVSLRRFLGALDAWKCDDANAGECFQFKSHFYDEMFHTTPNSPARDQLFNALLGWLQQNNYQRDHRVEWFYAVNVLIVRAFGDPQGMKDPVRALRESSDPVISLYAELERLLPRSMETTIRLL